MSSPNSSTVKRLIYPLLVFPFVLILACAPASNPTPQSTAPSKLLGSWQGKDPYDQSNITITIALTAGRYVLSATDDKTTADWCGNSATASATAELAANQTLAVNLLWVCNNSSKTKQTFPTVISYNSGDDSLTAYGTQFTRIK
jgi:hypothetical protein